MDYIPILLVFWSTSIILTVLTTEKCNKTDLCLLKEEHGVSSVCGAKNLQCEAHQAIRITHTTINKRTNKDDECKKCGQLDKIKLWSIADDDLMKIQYKLYQSCSYQTNCTLSDTFPTPGGIGNKKMWYIVIGYCCIDREITKIITDAETHLAIKHGVMSQLSPFDQCYCMIHGDVNITLVEYTPCIYNSCRDNSTKIYIDGEEPYKCGDDCKDIVYFNEPIQANNVVTNITIKNVHWDAMFWIMVKSTTTDGRPFVSCNMPITSSSSSYVTSTGTSQSTSPTNHSKLTYTTQPEASGFPVAAVTGGIIGSIACVAIIIVIVVFFKRFRRGKEPTVNDNQCNTIHVQSTVHQTTVGRGIVNNAYEPTIESSLNKHPEIRDDYSTPNDSVYDQPGGNFDPDSTVDGTNDTYTEPYSNDDDDDYATTTDGRNCRKDATTYDTFTESDTYSHIHTAGNNHVTPKSDIYSHLTLPVDNTHVGVTDASVLDDVYNHITLKDVNQGPDQQGFPLLIIVGAVVGSTVAVVIIIVVLLCVRRRARESIAANETSNHCKQVELETHADDVGVYTELSSCHYEADYATLNDNGEQLANVSVGDTSTASKDYSNIHEAGQNPTSSKTDNHSQDYVNACQVTYSYNPITMNVDNQRNGGPTANSDKGQCCI